MADRNRESGGRSRDPRKAFLDALRSGASERELAQLYQTFLRSGVDKDEALSLSEEAKTIDPERFRQAQLEQITLNMEAGEIQQGFPLLGGPGFKELGQIDLGAAATTEAQALAAIGRTALNNPGLAQRVLQFLSHHKKGVGIGVIGGAFAAGPAFIEGLGPIGAEGQPPLGAGAGPEAAAGEPGARITARPQGRVGITPGEKPPQPVGLAQMQTVDPGYNVLVVDRDGSLTGVPGQVAIIPPEDLGGGKWGLSPGTFNDIV